MAYSDYFKLADDIISHLDSVIHNINDTFISSRYVGFVSMSAVTVYELAIKEIFINFAEKKHSVFGTFVNSYFSRISGRIKYETIWTDYVRRFGDKYVNRLRLKVQKAEDTSLRNDGVSILSSYNNIIIWRNEFVHEGKLPSTASYDEVVKSYQTGKKVIDCLAETMHR
jgi:hypothetical protein